MYIHCQHLSNGIQQAAAAAGLPSWRQTAKYIVVFQILRYSEAGLLSMARLPGASAQQTAATATAGGCACLLGAQAGVGSMEAKLHALGQAETCSRQHGCSPLALKCADWDHLCMGRGV